MSQDPGTGAGPPPPLPPLQPQPGPSPLAPRLAVGEAIAATLAALRAHAGPIALAVLLAQLPLMGLVTLVGSEGSGYRLASNLTGFVQSGLVAAAVGARLRGERPGVGPLYAAVSTRFGTLMGVSFMGGLATLLGLLLLVVPGLMVAAGLYVTTPVVLAEQGLGASGALKRSWELTRGRRWPVLGVGAVALTVLVANLALVGLAVEVLPALPFHGLDVLAELVALPGLVAFTAAPAVVYERLRAEREGQDPRRLGEVFG